MHVCEHWLVLLVKLEARQSEEICSGSPSFAYRINHEVAPCAPSCDLWKRENFMSENTKIQGKNRLRKMSISCFAVLCYMRPKNKQKQYYVWKYFLWGIQCHRPHWWSHWRNIKREEKTPKFSVRDTGEPDVLRQREWNSACFHTLGGFPPHQ